MYLTETREEEGTGEKEFFRAQTDEKEPSICCFQKIPATPDVASPPPFLPFLCFFLLPPRRPISFARALGLLFLRRAG